MTSSTKEELEGNREGVEDYQRPCVGGAVCGSDGGLGLVFERVLSSLCLRESLASRMKGPSQKRRMRAGV